jgi:hypothetical protein
MILDIRPAGQNQIPSLQKNIEKNANLLDRKGPLSYCSLR